MESLAALYKNHIVTLQERTRDVPGPFFKWMLC
ncbi:Xaa-Pro dipeptidase PepQ [Klebsiella pneumoniae subsp. ozaenae]|uniref:Xaa-Pro dipeptidase PepQ n=1 Tax=Klebsiella pneumoniae subsp. ozaenae TaxID=574 RepID=A0A378AQN0_KLEPO|nr:Xaa-Pro dipeptidase PepQ [Klebsiella pneumoniae subsp. ozaenae]